MRDADESSQVTHPTPRLKEMAQNDKEIKRWKKAFSDPETQTGQQTKRIQEIDVALSELASITKESQVFTGTVGTVFFKSSLPETKSNLKREQDRLKKTANRHPTSTDLQF